VGLRQYDPLGGRFTTPDLIGFAGGLNRYAYAGGDPINFVDPSGLLSLSDVRNWYMGGMGGFSDLVDEGLMFNTWKSWGTAQGCYDAGRASGWDVAKAGGKALGLTVAYGAGDAALTWAERVLAVRFPMLIPGIATGTVAAITSEENNGSSTLFHYTTEEGMNGIIESEQLNPSLKALNPKDARYGDGQYLTNIIPGTKSPAQLSRAFINNPYQGQRFTHFVELDVTGLPIVQGRSNVLVVPGQIPLDLTGRIVSYGPIP
jgi:uncharacterized protein RhaS with RHS repeats